MSITSDICDERIDEIERKYIALIKDYSTSLVKASTERDRYKQALEQIVKSTSGTFRDIARDALNM